jgi:hypothetical protein
MKDFKKGFIVPWVIFIVIILAGGGVYLYSKNNQSVKNLNTNNIVNDDVSVKVNKQGWKLYENAKYKFSIQYPEQKWIDDGKSRYNGIYLNPIKKSKNFFPENVTLSIHTSDAECSRISNFKNPDSQTLLAGNLTFQHVSEKVKTPANKLIDNYEVLSKYFYSKGDVCYSATLHMSTSVSKLDLTDPKGDKLLTSAQLQALWKEIDEEVAAYESDFKEILEKFKFL